MSDSYIVSARKYRPATFASVVGQKNLTATLKGAIGAGRLAHAYLFCGPRGVGKTSCARIFARTINCLSPTPDGEACGECESCRAIEKGNSFNLMELDAASNNSVDDIRQINEQVNVPPQAGKYRVFIIDEVHMLTKNAFNAFLKTLEEPPSYAVFILATTEKHKVIPTILSRCQIYDFKRITINDMVDHLEYVAKSEGIKAERRGLGVIARKADGAMRDALSIFDQVAVSSGGDVTYEAAVRNLNVLDYDYFFRLVDAFAKGDASQSLLLYKDIRDRGFDSLFFVNSLARHVRDLMVAADPRTLGLLEVPDDTAKELSAQAASLPLQWYYSALRLLNDCDLNYRTATDKQLLVELTLIRLSQLLAPATPPFDHSDRPAALRDPSEQPRAATTSPPVAQPVTQPESEPTPQSAHQTTGNPTARHSGRPRSFSMHTADLKASSIERKRRPVGDAEFADAWNRCAASLSDRQMLAGAMRASVPRRTAPEEYELLVEHPGQLQMFEANSQRIISELRASLENDFITVKAAINPNREIKKMLTPAEFLAKVGKENETLAQFLKSIDSELA